MKHFVRLLLLFTPALIALGLLGVAFGTKWWTIPLEKNIPQENSLNTSLNDARLHSTLIPIKISRGLLSECIAYRNAKILVSNSFDFRENELKEPQENCSDYQFTCQTGVAIRRPLTRCIDRREKCNRIIDCEDKSDELSCEDNISIHDCPTGYTRCLDGKSCYRKDGQTCDGVSNCIDNADEKNCNEEKCRLNRHVYCPRERKCARRENSDRCDGIADCEDNSDEEYCQKCNGEPKVFSCDSKCILSKYRCDGTVQCSDFRDELNCVDYPTTSNHQGSIYHNDPLCIEKRYNPFDLYPPKIDSSVLAHYSHPDRFTEHLDIIFYLKFTVFYGITGGLLFIFFSLVSLLFVACCYHKCLSVPFFLYGLWILLAWLFICVALISFVYIWYWEKETLLDHEQNLPYNVMIHENNSSLRNLQFFGLSFWLACGAAFATFIGLLLSYCICCTIGSSRAEDKEYEIMHMQNY